MQAQIQLARTVCDWLAFGVCWTTAFAWVLGWLPAVTVILASTASFAWIMTQFYDRWRKAKRENNSE